MSAIALVALWWALVGLGWVYRPFRRRPVPERPTRSAERRVVPTVRLAVAAGAVAGAIGFIVSPYLAICLASAAAAVPLAIGRRAAAGQRAAVDAELPEAIELTRLALASTGSTLLAVTAVGAALSGPVGSALRRAAASSRDLRLADALLAEADGLGAGGRRFLRVLAGGERYGVAMGTALEQLAGEARRQRRRRAEAAARRIPVRLLLPLVGCILPAFVLLTLAPVLLRTLLSLGLGT